MTVQIWCTQPGSPKASPIEVRMYNAMKTMAIMEYALDVMFVLIDGHNQREND